MSDFVKIVEVGPRDGLQNEPTPLSVQTKATFIDKLSATGLRVVEAGSFVSPKYVPQMANTDQVLAQIGKPPGVQFPVLVPRLKYLEQAHAAGAEEIAIFASATETFSKKNINASIDESLGMFSEVAARARELGMKIRGYISCSLGCPYEGAVAPEKTAVVAKRLMEMGCYELSVSDTVGVGNPALMEQVVRATAVEVPMDQLAVHCHDTYGMALPNILRAFDLGVRVVDSSTCGLGGCPYAPGAAGNVATEDVLYLCNGLGLRTGVDEGQLWEASRFIANELGRTSQRQLKRAKPCANR